MHGDNYNIEGLNLTLTRVVFEFASIITFLNIIIYLTLTRVVFESTAFFFL